MKKLLAVVVIALAYYLIFTNTSKFQKDDSVLIDNAIKYNEKANNLKNEKIEIEKEIEKIEEESTVSNLGSIILFLTDTNTKHFNDAIRVMDEQGAHGIIALTEDVLNFDNYDYMSLDDLIYLDSMGYQFVITLTGKDNPQELYDKFTNYGFDISGFYALGIADQTIIDSVKETGCKVLIANSFISTDDDVFCIPKFGNMFPSIKTKFSDSVEYSGTIAISVGYSGMPYEEYNEDNYNAMFKFINPYVKDNLTAICNISEAKVRKESLDDYLSTINSEKEQKLAELNERIEEINKEILDPQ